MSVNRAASIHARLLEQAKHDSVDFNLMLARYALERWLYRLSISQARGEFMLKGALLFDLWFDVPHRPTRDADFLGFGPADAQVLARTVQMVCRIRADDGMQFDSESVNVMEIRKEANYDGLRVKFTGTLGKARCPMQLDVGYGDAVIPGPQEADYPTLLDDLPGPRLRVYPREAVVAEALENVVEELRDGLAEALIQARSYRQ